MADPIPSGSRSCRELRFSSTVYSLDTIKKAAYRMSDRCSFEFEVTGSDITCRLFFPDGASSDRTHAVEDEFRNELLDQDLRQVIAEETDAVRNVILAHAFSRTGLQGDDKV